MDTEAEIQRKLLKSLINRIIVRIKEVQQESKDAYSQEDMWTKNGVANELISWKILLEKWRKKLKYDGAESLCTECGSPLIEKWSGVKCSKCEHWECY